ncbi:phage fiber-tail adaptor protein [Pseudomonas sp. B392_1p]|uniref:phage fiber-tail adaptor protein n=1 Tax=Pseudomonas sp. B392_1p TaxID=3457507 RepID=UPI003FCFB65B
MTTFIKQPRDVLDYDVDMYDWFSELPGDDIQSVDVVVSSLAEPEPTLMVGPSPHPPLVLIGVHPVRFKLWLGGGTNYVDYVVTCVVTTQQDRQKEIEFKVKVRDR